MPNLFAVVLGVMLATAFAVCVWPPLGLLVLAVFFGLVGLFRDDGK